MAGYRHLTVFIARPGIAAQEIIDLLQSLNSLPGILEFTVKESLDTRKGTVIALNSLFTDETTFQAYRAAPEHQKVAGRMREIADWWVADYQD
jgi:heme-degrading monooxygenase HmoA